MQTPNFPLVQRFYVVGFEMQAAPFMIWEETRFGSPTFSHPSIMDIGTSFSVGRSNSECKHQLASE